MSFRRRSRLIGTLVFFFGAMISLPQSADAQKASPTISTQIAVTGSGSPGLGFTALGDTATLSGFASNVAGEVVHFLLYGPYATGVTPTCIGNPVFFTDESLSPSGVATTTSTFSPTVAGTYVWVASYDGDRSNNPVSGSCADANESATIVASTIAVSKAANPAGPVLAGSDVGFDLTVSNSGTVSALGVTLADNLPPGVDLNWSLNPAYSGCSITGAVGSQSLSCSLGTVPGSTSLSVIHVESPTTPSDCGTTLNSATVATTNGTGGSSGQASVRIPCSGLSISKTADAPVVAAGSPIGFTVAIQNSGNGGSSLDVEDPLPGGPGISWSIDSDIGDLNGCAINGSSPQTLTCTGDLGLGQAHFVHVRSSTTSASCGTYTNTASVSGFDNPLVTSNEASTTVLCDPVIPTLSPGFLLGLAALLSLAGGILAMRR